jgi:hypothetical protein
MAAVIQGGVVSNDSSTVPGSQVRAREQLVFPDFLTLFAFIRGSDLFSIDVSKVVDVPICTQFVFAE